MIMDLYPEDNSTLAAPTGLPVEGPEAGAGERFSTIFRSMTNANNDGSSMRNIAEAYQKKADDFYRLTGQRVPNPVQPFTSLSGNLEKARPYRGRGGNFRKLVDEWNAENPDRLFIMPSDADMQQEGLALGKEAFNKAQALERRVGGSGWSGFAGSLAGAGLDPWNVASMPFGGSGSLVRIFLQEAGIGLAAGAGSEASNFAYRQQINPQHSVGDAVTGALLGGAAQGVLATSIAGGVRGLAWLFNRNRAAADPLARDAGNVTMGDALNDVRAPQSDPDLHARTVATMNRAIDDARAGNPIRENPDLLAGMSGRTGTVFDANNTPHQVRYEVVDARDLTTSHLDDFRENPAFPQEYQPRDRTRSYSEAQINDIAANLVPERLGPSLDASTGAPIVGPDGLVESGNGRVLAIRRAYQGGMVPADRYAAWLKRMGFDIDGMDQPVLIARRMSSLDDAGRQTFVKAAQDSGTMRLSASEAARSDAGKLDSDMLAILAPGRISSAKNRDFVRKFAERMGKGERAALYDANGELSVEGIKRIEAALAARAYDDSVFLARVLEDADNNIKSIGGAMVDAAGAWAQLRADIMAGRVPAHLDITGDLLDALRLVMRARDEGRPVAEMVAQGDLLFEASPTVISLLKAMFRDEEFKKPIARSKLAELLQDYATEARKVSDGPVLLGDPLTSGQVLEGAFNRAERADLAAVAARLDNPAEVRERMMTPEGQDAVVQEAYRQAIPAEGRADILVDDGTGTMRPASEVLMELDDMAAAAKELQACAIGRDAAE